MKNSDPLQTDWACMFKFSCSNLPTAMLSVDVTENTLTTMSTQLQPDSYVMMMKPIAQSTLTHTILNTAAN